MSSETVKTTIEDKLIIIPVNTALRLLSFENGLDAYSLYSFYIITAKTQNTKSIRATKSYCMQGLKWGEKRFHSAKNILLSLRLIENVQRKDHENNITGWFIKINYLWNENRVDINEIMKKKNTVADNVGITIEEEPPPTQSTIVQKHPSSSTIVDSPEAGSCRQMLNEDNINALGSKLNATPENFENDNDTQSLTASISPTQSPPPPIPPTSPDDWSDLEDLKRNDLYFGTDRFDSIVRNVRYPNTLREQVYDLWYIYGTLIRDDTPRNKAIGALNKFVSTHNYTYYSIKFAIYKYYFKRLEQNSDLKYAKGIEKFIEEDLITILERDMVNKLMTRYDFVRNFPYIQSSIDHFKNTKPKLPCRTKTII